MRSGELLVMMMLGVDPFKLRLENFWQTFVLSRNEQPFLLGLGLSEVEEEFGDSYLKVFFLYMFIIIIEYLGSHLMQGWFRFRSISSFFCIIKENLKLLKAKLSVPI